MKLIFLHRRFPQRITTSPSNGSINGVVADEVNKSNSAATGFEYQNNALNKRSPSVSPTIQELTSSPIIPNKPVTSTQCDSNSPSNSHAVPISSSLNSPASPLKNESSELNAKTSPKYTGKWKMQTHARHTISLDPYFRHPIESTMLTQHKKRQKKTIET